MAVKLFGSGYVWLCLENTPGSRRLQLVETVNQVSPLSQGYRPLLGIDVWEHAYYLQYVNKRADYVNTWWAIVDWDKVNLLLSTWLEAEDSSTPGKDSVSASATLTPPSKVEL